MVMRREEITAPVLASHHQVSKVIQIQSQKKEREFGKASREFTMEEVVVSLFPAISAWIMEEKTKRTSHWLHSCKIFENKFSEKDTAPIRKRNCNILWAGIKSVLNKQKDTLCFWEGIIKTIKM